MGCKLSRRGMLRFLVFALPATLFGYRRTDYFDAELVCVHVYDPTRDLPPPLTDVQLRIEKRPEDADYFQMGLPELIWCETPTPLLDLFLYFWPVTRPEIQRFQKSSEILYSLPVIEQIDQLAELEGTLNRTKTHKGSLAVILTLNDYTQNACLRLVNICRAEGVAELVIFKDPSKPPYLCSYPSQQKGFKKKPPIGAGFSIRSIA